MDIDLKKCSIPLLRAIVEESKNKDHIREVLAFNEKAVFKEVAENVNTDTDILQYLYQKYGKEVVWKLAKNTSTPQEVLHDIVSEAENRDLLGILLDNNMLAEKDIDLIVQKIVNSPWSEDIRACFLLKKAINNCNISAKTLLEIADIYPEFLREIVDTGKVKLVAKEI